MIKLLKYDLNSTYESNKESLNQLDNYVALTEDNQIVHLKPLNIFYVTTNNSGTTIYKRIDNQNKKETVTLENGKNKLTDWNYGFYFDIGMKQEQITSFDLSKYDTSNVTNMDSMFSCCTNLTSLDVSNFDTSKVTNMYGMFYYCSGLTSLNVTKFNTTNVTSMSNMFYRCSGLTSLNVTKFNTTNVTSMSNMFNNCYNLKSLDVTNFDTSNVTKMSGMFQYCSGLTLLDLSNFDTTNVISMSGMFSGCSGLTSLDLSSFDTANVTAMSNMFYGCTNLTHIKCKQAFKDWCITNQDTIKLPTAMRNGTVGNDSSYNWEIVDIQS